MIVKVQMSAGQDSWFFFDRAQEVSVSHFEKTERKDFFKERVEGVRRFEFLRDTTTVPAMSALVAFFYHGEPVEIELDTSAYLMTDEGKTIERIY